MPEPTEILWKISKKQINIGCTRSDITINTTGITRTFLVGITVIMNNTGRSKANNGFLDKRGHLLCLAFSCPCAPATKKCPFLDIRKKTLKEQIRWAQQLTDTQIKNMVVFHKACRFNKEHKATLL
jgi:hypothetical protein